jgi:hypothetical protein
MTGWERIPEQSKVLRGWVPGPHSATAFGLGDRGVWPACEKQMDSQLCTAQDMSPGTDLKRGICEEGPEWTDPDSVPT